MVSVDKAELNESVTFFCKVELVGENYKGEGVSKELITEERLLYVLQTSQDREDFILEAEEASQGINKKKILLNKYMTFLK